MKHIYTGKNIIKLVYWFYWFTCYQGFKVETMEEKEYKKTTYMIENNLRKQLKIMALNQDKTLKELVNEYLSNCLERDKKIYPIEE